MSLQLLSVLMFAMISNQAWQPNMEGQEYCIINNSGTLSSQSCIEEYKSFHPSRHCLPVPKCGGRHCLPGFHRSVNFIKSSLCIVTFRSEGFLVGEFFFDEMSSVKSRKHFVVADLAFSGISAVTQLSCRVCEMTFLPPRFLDSCLYFVFSDNAVRVD